VKVADNHFVGDFFDLNSENPCFEIAVKFSFQDRKHIFHELSPRINNVVELPSHFLMISTPNNLVIPEANRDNGIGVKVFPDQSMNCFRVLSFIHDVTIGLSGFVALSE